MTTMMKRKSLLAAGLALCLMAGSVTVSAAPGMKGGEKGRDCAGFCSFGARGFVKGLNLTDDQKSQIKQVLTNSRTRILEVRRDLVKARLDLSKGLPDAAAALANAQVAVAHLKTQLFEQIRPLLTAEQISKVDARIQQREQRLQQRLDRINSRIGE